MVMSPELRRPPVRCLMVSNGLYGLSVVISSLTSVVLNRNDGVIGRYVLIGIVSSLYPQVAFTRVRPAYLAPNPQSLSPHPTPCSLHPGFRDCSHSPASSRPTSGAHTPSSSRDDSR